MKRTIFLSTLLLVFAVDCLAREVPINPITPDIRNKLQESTALIGNVEQDMAPKVNELEKIYRTYNETCGEGSQDGGCVEMQNQLKAEYREILNSMAENLPVVRKTVLSTVQDLGHSISAKTRQKDLRELYEDLSRRGSYPEIRGPLSKKLSELTQAMGSHSSNISILELSLRTQADLISATEYLDYLEARMSHQLVFVDMVQDFGMLSPEMASVMSGVSELFGYDVDFGAELVVDYETSSDWRN